MMMKMMIIISSMMVIRFMGIKKERPMLKKINKSGIRQI